MPALVANILVVSDPKAIIPKVQPNTHHHCQTVCLSVKNLPHPPWSLPVLRPYCRALISYWSIETGFCSNVLCCTHSLWPACAGLYRCMSWKSSHNGYTTNEGTPGYRQGMGYFYVLLLVSPLFNNRGPLGQVEVLPKSPLTSVLRSTEGTASISAAAAAHGDMMNYLGLLSPTMHFTHSELKNTNVYTYI